MHRMKTQSRHVATVAGLLALLAISSWSAPVRGQAPAATGVTVFEGARLIVGDGRAPIENATFVVTGNRFTQVGRAGEVKVPAGATRVSLAGKTVMPAIIDTHTHLSQTREALIEDLRRRAYYGVSAAMSMGQDTSDVPFQVRAETIPGAARFFTAGRGITMPEPGRTEAPFWVSTVAEARKAVQENAARKVDIIKIWVDDRNGTVKKLTPELYGAIIDEAHKNKPPRHRAHLHARGRERDCCAPASTRSRTACATSDIDDEFMALVKTAPEPRAQSEPAGPWRARRISAG